MVALLAPTPPQPNAPSPPPLLNALPPQGMCAAFSAMGASVPLPLRPERGYEFEFAMFGGATQGKGRE